MAKFIAGEAVEDLEWDFTDFGQGEGVVPEPTTKRLNGYRTMIKRIAHDVREFRGQNAGIEGFDPDTMDEDEALETLDSMDEAMAQAEGFQQRSIEALAFLCGSDWEAQEGVVDGFEPRLLGGSPTMEALEALPYRVLQAFGQWVMGELTPKRETGETPNRPTANDFKPSRKAVKRSTTSRRGTSRKA